MGFRIEMNSRENKLSDVWYEQRLNNEQRILHFKGCGISHKIDDRVNTETTDIYVTHEGKVHQATQVKNLETGETTFTFFEDQKSVDASGIPVDTLSKAFGYQTPEALLKVITDQPGRIKLVMEEIARAKFQNRDSSGVIAEIIKKEQPQPGS